MPAVSPRFSLKLPEWPSRTSPMALPELRFGNEQADLFAIQQPKTLLVLNGHAGSVYGETEQRVREALQRFPEAVRSQVVIYTAPDIPSLRQTIAEHQGHLERVIAAGGDGTITQVISAAIPYEHLKIGILPLGTGNQLAKTLKIPTDLEGALKTALEGEPYLIDVGSVNGKQCFTQMAGAGIDAAIMEKSNKSPAKRFLRNGVYLWHAFNEMIRGELATYHVEADNVKITRKGVGVLVANTADLFNTISLIPGSKINDGTFDVAIFAAHTYVDYLKAAYQILTGKLGDTKQRTGVIHLKAKHIKITTDRPVNSQVDGDVIGKTPLEIQYIRQVPILVPPQPRP
jgi:YegS/Rv2252/BmrU family lipid kinase